MNNRWKMNRIGFVNFWLYDNESFELEDGKILLRGQNGSGKSITTQSFIPFVLDGDRTPSRLDPFGTSDRRMEYYFLGDNEKDESTGYLYLEFKKEDSQEYRTIGIGQSAHKGRPMNFWGFVILNNKRINVDFNLFRQSGEKIIPYDKQELKKVLGEDTPFTDSQKEYKEMVNQYLFGFERIEQYEQYIKLLIKVRAPKLSNNFKPTRIYEILNDSLQVLSDNDLSAMVEAMEKMDNIQEILEGLKRSLNDASQIMKEYEHYNRYMLAKKAKNYLDGKTKASQSLNEYENTIKQISDWNVMKQSLTGELNRLSLMEEAIRKEIEQLTDPSLENLDVKLQNLKKDLEENNKEKENKEKQINQKREQIQVLENTIRELNNKAEYAQKQINDYLNNLEDLQNEIKSDFHQDVKQDIPNIESDLIISQIDTLRSTVTNGRKLLSKYKDADNKYQDVLNRANENNNELNNNEKEYDELNKEKELQQDLLLSDMDALKDNKYWQVSIKTIEDSKEIIEQYNEESDSYKLKDILEKDFEAKKDKEKDQLISLKNEATALQKEISDTQAKYREVLEQKIIEPSHDTQTTMARELLKQAGIKAYPFYQTIEFNDNLSPAKQAILEKQLHKAGLLDALVVNHNDYQRIQKEFNKLNDVIICETKQGDNEFNDLKVDESIDEDIKEIVNNILSHFSKENGNYVFSDNGYFKQGILQGYADKETSEYIGINARKRKKEQLLSEIKNQIEELEEKLSNKRNEIDDKNNYLLNMTDEFNNSFSTDKINQIINSMHQLLLHINELKRNKELLEKQVSDAYSTLKQVEREMLEVCKNLPYTRSVEEYDNILSYLDDYKNTFNKLVNREMENNHYLEQIVSKENDKDNYLSEIDDISLEKDKFSNKINSINEQLKRLQEILENPEIIEKTRKLMDARNRQAETINQKNEVDKKLSIIIHDLENADASLKVKEENKNADEEYLRYVSMCLEEELSLNLVLAKNELSLKDNAKSALALKEDAYMIKSASEMASNLYTVYQKYNSNLSSYNTTIERCFETNDEEKADRSRLLVNSIWAGKKLDLNQFIKEIENAIANQEELIRQKDRELFEDILSQTISQKLSDRIDESANWVKEMSSLMKNMDTSMGLSFSLEWKPKKADDIDEMDIRELEKLLTKDKVLVSEEEMTKVSKHFRSIIQKEKLKQEMNNEIPNYLDLVRNALDYRKWYEFRMDYTRVNENKKELTNKAFNTFSGGEKAMAMYVPLFAAVNAQYKKAKLADHPRMIALDEAFAGVDDKNIASMFKMVEELDFDYIMNSQALWGCYQTVKRLKIVELLRPLNSNTITPINYIWNGKEKIYNER